MGQERPGALIIPYQVDQIAALRAVIATWMRLAIFQALAGLHFDTLLEP